MGKERPKHVELPEKKTIRSDITLVTCMYYNTMHGTLKLKYEKHYLKQHSLFDETFSVKHGTSKDFKYLFL
jgi:hypothetical protein